MDLGYQKKEFVANQLSINNYHSRRLEPSLTYKPSQKSNKRILFLELEKRELKFN